MRNLRRFIDPSLETEKQTHAEIGYVPQRDITDSVDKTNAVPRDSFLTIMDRVSLRSRKIKKLKFTGDLAVSTLDDTATIDVSVDTTIYTTLTEDGDVGAASYSGQFLIEDSAITDSSVIQVWHVGTDERDDEPEMDGILCIPNPPGNGQLRVNWHAIPGPVAGSHAFRYLIAASAS